MLKRAFAFFCHSTIILADTPLILEAIADNTADEKKAYEFCEDDRLDTLGITQDNIFDLVLQLDEIFGIEIDENIPDNWFYVSDVVQSVLGLLWKNETNLI